MSEFKSSGSVRRIDDLGRIVIPKEIRRTLCIRDGDPMEILYDETTRSVLFRPYMVGLESKNLLEGVYEHMPMESAEQIAARKKVKEAIDLLKQSRT